MKRHIAKSFFEILMKLYETKPTIADKTAVLLIALKSDMPTKPLKPLTLLTELLTMMILMQIATDWMMPT